MEELIVDAPKTKILVKKLKELSLEKVTIVVDKLDENLLLSARNIKGVEVVEVSDINPVSLVGAEKVLFTLTAIKKAEELFSETQRLYSSPGVHISKRLIDCNRELLYFRVLKDATVSEIKERSKNL